jgi:hypothetical protein
LDWFHLPLHLALADVSLFGDRQLFRQVDT